MLVSIKKFVEINGRIPAKREVNPLYKMTRRHFGTWNKGIKAAGFDPNPGNKGFTCDFIIENKWVEFFGLSWELRKYDNLMRRKMNLAKKYDLDLVKIYPKDIFPIRNLKEKLNFI